MSQLTSLINRLFFVASFVLAGTAVLEKLANFLGYTIIRGAYDPGRLLEFAAVALLFVFALLLRDIQHALVNKARH
jgi:hypothetical protein